MATKTVSNKELNEKVDKLTEMFQTFLQNQSVKDVSEKLIEEKIVVKQRGRPRGTRTNSIIVDEGTSEPQIARKRRVSWENTFVDERKEHMDDAEIDKKLAIVQPVDKGVRKSTMVKSVCSSCEKSESVPKQFVFEGHHTCQKCLKNKVGK